MQCVILAAGEGKRMRPLTSKRPKVMLPLANRPMAGHLLCAAREAGIREFIFVVGYQEQEVRNYFGDGSDFDVRIRYVTQRRQKGTADALRATEDLISGPFLMLNGDMVVKSQDIAGILEKSPPCAGIYHSDHPWDYGMIMMEENLVTGLEEKSDQPKSTLINAGIYLMTPGIFDLLKSVTSSPRGEYEITDVLMTYIRHHDLTGYQLSSWLDVGYPWDLLDANAGLLACIEPVVAGNIEEGVQIRGTVSVGRGTIVKSGTYIEGPCIIGENCSIGPHAYIRGATAIGDGCHIGHCTEIKNSVIMNNTKIPHFNYLGDTVVGSGCNFGAGTKVANLRHDRASVKIRGIDTRRIKLGAVIGDDVRFGINCSINVGTVIGSRVSVAPHCFVEGWIDEETKVR
jgi:UDP-N-acetylglucosamine diphosphorylase / glucose-1-phosphate thymidylyltransferase / UDP-N-acetylgalactosamine diphosphorylase / glucosamine-1-phosphate N-acetyltransferase / galactosamine-1-phosphate N-acetyltransferase